MCTRAVIILAMLLIPAAYASPQESEFPPLEISLDGTWEFLLDPTNKHKEDPGRLADSAAWANALPMAIPGILESLPETVGYDGVVWYRRDLPAVVSPASSEGKLMLAFDNVNYRAEVWLDGEFLGRHDGSDAPFRFDVSNRLDQESILIVRCVDPGRKLVDGLHLGALPHSKESWYYNYGGILGSVQVERVPLLEVLRHDVERKADGTDHLTMVVHNHSHEPVEASVSITIEPGRPYIEISRQPLPPGPTKFTVQISEGELEAWSPQNPSLHSVKTLITAGQLRWTDQFQIGLRQFEIKENHFALNGEPLYLKGVLYQPSFPKGLANPPDPGFLRDDLLAIKQAGFNLVRAHLRSSPELYALCDEIGLLVHAEPSLGWITSPRAETDAAVETALSAFSDAVSGHPSVVLVGLLNELSGSLYLQTNALRERLQSQLPSQLILDDSGSWQGTAHYLAPESAEPTPYDDLHIYRSWPWDEDDFAEIASLGQDHEQLIYVSEYGFGGTPAFQTNIAGFEGHLYLEDAQEYMSQFRMAVESLQGSPLANLVNDISGLTLVGQRSQARATESMTRALRANPRIAGDCYTQWRDVSWESGAGLCDVWGNPKPSLGVMATLNKGLGLLPPPQLPSEVLLPPRELRPVALGTLLSVEPEIMAVIDPILEKPDRFDLGLPRLVITGVRNNRWGPDELTQTVNLLRFVRSGGVLLMLNPPDAGHPFPQMLFGYDGHGQVSDLPFEATSLPSRGHFIGTHFLFATDSPLLKDFPWTSRTLDERLAAVSPHRVLHVPQEESLKVELACIDGYGLYRGAAVQAVPYGKGLVILNTLRFDPERMTSPTTQRILQNLVLLSAGWAARLPPNDPVAYQAIDQETSKGISQGVWRHKIYFGLAERLTVQQFNGQRPIRDPPPDLSHHVRRKNTALDTILAGDPEKGLQLLSNINLGLSLENELFIRSELLLSDAFNRDDRPTPWPLPESLLIGQSYQRALRLMRLGEVDAAMAELEHATNRAEEGPRQP